MKTLPRVASYGISFLLVLATACGGDTPETPSKPFVFAVVSNYTTPAGTFQKIAYDGLEARIRWASDQGGVADRTIELVKRDIAGDTARLQASYREVAGRQDVLAVLGLGQSAQQAALPELVQQSRVTSVSIPGGGPSLFQGPHDYLWAAQIDVIQGFPKAGAAFVAQQTPEAKAAVIGVDTPSLRAAADGFARELGSKGGSVIASESLPVDATDAGAALGRLLRDDPSWLVITGATPGLLQSIINNVKLNAKPTLKIFAMANGAATTSFSRIGSESYFAATPAAPALDPASTGARTMREAAEKYSLSPSLQIDDTVFTMGWVVGEILLEALEKCGSTCTRAGFHSAFAKAGEVDVGDLASGLTVDKVNPQIFRTMRVLGWDAQQRAPEWVGDWIPLY